MDKRESGARANLKVFLFSADNESPLKVECRTNDFFHFLSFFAIKVVYFFYRRYMTNYVNDVV